ncbi:hydantoinase/oxoprolinase family protein [Pseudohoeflea coraliihabitans]|uniref:Hydantoinase/oxoprolinase family protein n=1 Tax=Pseudohoeflea coraliihabitans TaxID=2860393 RepID=A0ABS6WQ28_9HYPH|nr:hydantoinase/oxoprolinase family protein [Pseudohoeflea sp. DP4N28-3]MBW3097169.1 hydantoinase/oxoprolinase family protein [Pseudohoeflea sp. DP4N28-3]
MKDKARIGVDIGGTFTDVALEVADERYTVKKLTTHTAPEEGVLAGLTEVVEAAGIAPSDVGLVIHGTTLATNALIERKGARTALVTTEGFRDVLEIRGEDRYEQYDLTIELPRPLIPRRLRFTVPERMNADGTVFRPLDEAELERVGEALAEAGAEAVAIGFLHSYRNGVHERRAREVLSYSLPEVSFSISSEVAPEMREYDRFSTAAANAYVQPLMARYLDRLQARLNALEFTCPLLLMLSGGGLTTIDVAKRFPVRLVESGPAGGAAFAADIAVRCGLGDVLSFDMGGTTAKLCLIDGGVPHRSRDFEVDRMWRFRKGSGLPLRIPVIEMVEIGAGGGSIAGVDALGRVTVGPKSAGSEPGPACYGRGGTHPTVTDADLILGRLDGKNFAGGKMALVEDKASESLISQIGIRLDLEAEHAALSVVEMVEENMSSAARVHAVERGYDMTDRTMIAFGGAAPVHALRMAEKLGIDRVVIPKGAGVGSAIGFLRAPISFEVVQSLHQLVDELDEVAVRNLLEKAHGEAADIVRKAAGTAELNVVRKVSMRYVGQGHEIEVAMPERDDNMAVELNRAFEEAYIGFYGRLVPEGRIECLTWSVTVATSHSQATGSKDSSVAAGGAPQCLGTRRVIDPRTGQAGDCHVYLRTDLTAGAGISGPAIIIEDETSTYVPESFNATIGAFGIIDCQRIGVPK